MRFELPAQKPARGEIRPLGCRELRAPTWRDLNAPLFGLPAPAGSANRRVDQIHLYLFTAVCVPVQRTSATPVISPSYRAGNDYEYFSHRSRRRCRLNCRCSYLSYRFMQTSLRRQATIEFNKRTQPLGILV